MNNGRLILTDAKPGGHLTDFFDYKKIDFQFLPKSPGTPLVDVISDRISGKDDVVLILGNMDNTLTSSLDDLYGQVSEYGNDFIKLCSKVKLVIHNDNSDIILYLTGKDKPFTEWLNNLKPFILCDGKPGQRLRTEFKDCQFIEFFYPFLQNSITLPEIGILKNHQPKKDYLCLMTDKSNRPFRRLLNEQIVSKGLEDSMIYKFNKKTETLDDLKLSYQDKILGRLTNTGQFLPSIEFYNQTNIEIATEGISRDYDDSFDPTEKTTKPIAMKHPFMMLANRHFLKNLRSLGFKTFHDHFDESYDDESLVSKRIEIITNNMIGLRGNTFQVYQDTKEIREHNHLNLQRCGGEWKTNLWKTIDEFWKNI